MRGGYAAARASQHLTYELALVVLFVVGAARSKVGAGRWWTNGLEMLGLGVIVGIAAYFVGALVSSLVGMDDGAL